ncbi:hypothetical protein L9F63_013538, partial [Diploptera punctata]
NFSVLYSIDCDAQMSAQKPLTSSFVMDHIEFYHGRRHKPILMPRRLRAANCYSNIQFKNPNAVCPQMMDSSFPSSNIAPLPAKQQNTEDRKLQHIMFAIVEKLATTIKFTFAFTNTFISPSLMCKGGLHIYAICMKYIQCTLVLHSYPQTMWKILQKISGLLASREERLPLAAGEKRHCVRLSTMDSSSPIAGRTRQRSTNKPKLTVSDTNRPATATAPVPRSKPRAPLPPTASPATDGVA